MQSVMKHDFSRVAANPTPRTTLDRSHGHKTAINAGYLYPIFIDEIVPGDVVNLNTTIFARMSTPVYPIMDNLFADIHWFFVPNRLIWDNWENFCGQQDYPGQSTDYTIPVVTCPSGGFAEDSIYDYMGIPPGIDNLDISALPFRAYNLCFHEWYRDQNLTNAPYNRTGAGPDTYTDYNLLRRKKRHDYFTSALPWPQKTDGTDEITLPLGTQAPVVGIGSAVSTANAGPLSVYETHNSTPESYSHYYNAADIRMETDNTLSAYPPIYAALTNAPAPTINELRQAFQLQKLLEKDARGGTRYPEILRSHFGVYDASMAVLQRPEYLGGSTFPVGITPIAQTSESGTTDLGTLGGYGTITGSGNVVKSFTEHGWLLGLVSIRSDLTYQQGVEKMFWRETRYDHYWPSLAQIGEQTIENREIYAQGTSDDTLVFGYQERFAEMRYKPSRISSQMRSTHTTPLDAWHLSQEFTSLPTLGSTFIDESPPMTRVLASSTAPHFIVDTFFRYRHTRPMPVYAVPGMIDHF